MKTKIIEELVAKIEEYQIAKGNTPSAIIMNNKDVKGLLDSVKIGDTIVNYRRIYIYIISNSKILRYIGVLILIEVYLK